MSPRSFYVDLVARVRAALGWAPAPLASAIVLGLAACAGLLAHRLCASALLRLPGTRGKAIRGAVEQTRGATRLFFVIAFVVTALPVSGFSYETVATIGQVLLVVFILLVGYTASRAVAFLSESYLSRFSLSSEDNLVARKHTTQIRILRRATDILLFLVTIATALMTIGPVREYGLSLFASAGAASLVVGLAARPLLTNLIAGVQIAVTQPIRMEDAVVVEGEWGWVEEITATYVVVRLWDWRRMILPISYFLEKPFQNWTHQSASLIGSVFLHVDYTTPVASLRTRLEELARAHPLWDGNVVNLQVSDATEHTMQIRMLVSARNAPQSWDLRCAIREGMIEHLRQTMPAVLPRARVELGAAGAPAQASADSAAPARSPVVSAGTSGST